ncbi:MAG: hypothetical protein AAGI27_05175 [Pseudomonadota bacterium]
MSITINTGDDPRNRLQVATDCPYCNVFAKMTPQSLPDVELLIQTQPKHVGIVFQCDYCEAPVFLRYGLKRADQHGIELYNNFVELERPPERFPFSYLPKPTEILFREALTCYSNNAYNAFASMCRRATVSAIEHLGDSGRMQAFEELIVAQDIAEIDDATLDPIKTILFEAGGDENLPILNRRQAGILLELLKDLFYQCFVRSGKLTRAIRVRNLFVRDDAANSA